MTGSPGVGKSHAAAALGHALVEAGRTVLFLPVYKLVQELLAAKQTLRLPHMLRKLDLFEPKCSSPCWRSATSGAA